MDKKEQSRYYLSSLSSQESLDLQIFHWLELTLNDTISFFLSFTPKCGRLPGADLLRFLSKYETLFYPIPKHMYKLERRIPFGILPTFL